MTGTLAFPIGRGPARIVRWFAVAWQNLRLRHFLIALLIELIYPFLGPAGGILFSVAPITFDPWASLLRGRWVIAILPMVFAVLVADAAFEDGVHPTIAYGLALVISAIAAPLASIFLVDIGIVHWGRSAPYLRIYTNLLLGALAFSAIAYWRVTQRTLKRIRQLEADRLRAKQRLSGSRLLALQARVDPQLLFDALTYIGDRHLRDPTGADGVLDELIVLLRAMLPDTHGLSTVAREFALMDAWTRVSAHLERMPTLSAEAQPEALDEPVAPMLLVPLIQATFAATQVSRWSVECKIVGTRLQLALWVDENGATLAAPPDDALLPLRRRLDEVYGDDAHLIVHPDPLQLVYDLPRLTKEDAP